MMTDDLPPSSAPVDPNGTDHQGVNVGLASDDGTVTTEPSRVREIAQLVIIPAAIVVIAIGLGSLFAKVVSGRQTIASQLAILERSGGVSKDRWWAAYTLATMIPSVDDLKMRADISKDLVRVLNQVDPGESGKVHQFLILALGQLGQRPDLDAILSHAGSSYVRVRLGVAQALRHWPDHDREFSRRGLGALTNLLVDENPQISGVAALTLGLVAKPEDVEVVKVLRQAMDNTNAAYRETVWNSAVALAKLGDQRGSQLVSELLLSRKSLLELPSDYKSPGKFMSTAEQDRVILSTLAHARPMSNELVWERIRQIADSEPNKLLRATARNLLLDREDSTVDAKGTEPSGTGTISGEGGNEGR
ncbi:MAG: hypothetical protein CMJ20_11570 [Phycisphaeraceae bacterium]|nr:hypothetical protein [Phycisphaeraceae bacterium]